MNKKLTVEDLNVGTMLVHIVKSKDVFMVVEKIKEKNSIGINNYKLLNLCTGKTCVLSINIIKENYKLTIGEEIKLW